MRMSYLTLILIICLFQGSIQAPYPDENIKDVFREGDMELTPDLYARRRGTPNENAIISPNKKWPDKTVRYEISDNISNNNTQFIRTTLNNLQNKIGCLQFVETSHGNRVSIQDKEDGCFAVVGYTGWETQKLNLNPSWCMTENTIEHEFLHSLGVFHHHSRPDRDEYVNIIWDNIKPRARSQFTLLGNDKAETFGIPYDYSSIMHYSSKAGAIDYSKNTIETKDKSKQHLLGNEGTVTESDIKLVHNMYGCDATPNPTGPIRPTGGNCPYTDGNAELCPKWASGGHCTTSVPNQNVKKFCPKSCCQII